MKTIYVANLPNDTDETETRGLFSPYGTALTIRLSPGGSGREHQGAGFVEMETAEADNAIGEVDERGERLVGDTLLLLLNADGNGIDFTLPSHDAEEHWELLFDTAVHSPTYTEFTQTESYSLQGRSVAGLRLLSRQEQVESDRDDP